MLFGLGSVTISTEIYLLCAGPICHSSFYKIFELFDIFEKNLFIQKGECDSRWSSLGGILGPNWPISVVPLVARDSAVHPRQPDEKGQKLWTLLHHGTVRPSPFLVDPGPYVAILEKWLLEETCWWNIFGSVEQVNSQKKKKNNSKSKKICYKAFYETPTNGYQFCCTEYRETIWKHLCSCVFF